MIRKLPLLVLCLVLILSITLPYSQKASAATFNQNRIIDDRIFDNADSMTASAIDSFLNSFASSCISPNSGFKAIDPIGYNPSQGYLYGGYVTAGQVIYDSAQAYGINPQVLITTLEKEQSLVTGQNNFAGYCNNGDQHKYAAAVGYGCPDSGTTYSYTGLNLYQRNGITISDTGTTCVNTAIKAGFSQQVIRAAWLLKFGEQRSKGNINWAVVKGNWDNSDDPQTCYGGPMTQGTWQRCPSGGAAYYDGYTTIDATAVHMDTGATAALYWYTPHFHGNQVFFSLFTSWFGSTWTDYCLQPYTTNVGYSVEFSRQNHIDHPNFIIESGSASNCVEFHGWTTSMNSWATHTASNLSAINTADSEILYGDIDGDGTDEPILVAFNHTGSGMVEFHVWNYDTKSWRAHIVSNYPVSQYNPANMSISFADLTGRGYDQAILAVDQASGSGMVEFHVWNPGMQSWQTHLASNYPVSQYNPANMSISFADLTGRGYDQAILDVYRNTGSGQIEFHVWNPWMQSWQSHIASNLAGVDPANFNINFANVSGRGYDQAVLTALHGTGSGQIEFHVWNPWMQSWQSHIASNQTTIP